MNKINQKNPRNNRGQPHGHWRWYRDNGLLYYKGNWHNFMKIGYWVWYGYAYNGDKVFPIRKEYMIK